MENQVENINARYEQFYAQRSKQNVYPTEFVVRTFLANYPKLNLAKPVAGSKILDVGFGDGRNMAFLCSQELDVSGIEITQKIVDQTKTRMIGLGYNPNLQVGRNSSIPFSNEYFDYILASHCCYYCDNGQTLSDNLNEYARVLKSGGYLIASVANKLSYIFKDAKHLDDGTMLVSNDPYNNRNGYRLFAFNNADEIKEYFGELYTNFSFGSADNDYYGIEEKVFWVVCQKK